MKSVRRPLLRFVWLAVSILGIYQAAVGSCRPDRFTNGDVLSIPDIAPGRRSLMSDPPGQTPKRNLTVTSDGKIELVSMDTGEALWSLSTGTPIYSSYQATNYRRNGKATIFGRNEEFFIDCEGDGNLYAHNGLTKWPLGKSIDNLVNTPMLLEDGAVIIGSKESSVIVIDALSGRLINIHKLPPKVENGEKNSVRHKMARKDQVALESRNPNQTEYSLHIIRTDYQLQAQNSNSQVLWNIAFSNMTTSVCRANRSSSGGVPGNLVSGYESDVEGPLSCYSTAIIDPNYMIPGESKSPSSSRKVLMDLSGMLPDSLPEGKVTLLHSGGSQQTAENSIHVGDKIVSSSIPVLESTVPPSDNSTVQSGISREFSLVAVSIYIFLAANGYAILLLGVIILGVVWKIIEHNKQPSKCNARVVTAKNKKKRKSAKNNSLLEKKDNIISPKNEFGMTWNQNVNLPLADRLVGSSGNRKRIGKLFITGKEIAKGSNGTIVLEGIYDGRPVAVKRLLQAHHDVAFKEIQNLIASDQHPNIVRWFGVEYDQDFVYLSLERCACSLDDLIQTCLTSFKVDSQTYQQSVGSYTGSNFMLESLKYLVQDANLWKESGHPSPILLQLMRDMVSGIQHLHELGIVHRDVKPQNMLIIEERGLCAKISDMGISKRLQGSMSSLDKSVTGCGSSGWQAPEQLLQGRQTRAVDMFSLGCVLFYCVTGGRHPFGDHLERDVNIVKNQVDLFLVEHMPEAVDLFSRLLSPNPDLRPKASMVLRHPMFWSSEMRLSFLRDTSDRVELEDREASSEFLKDLEDTALVALGTKWDEKLEPAFISNIGRYRRYKYDSIRDLLRVMRNKLNHYRELPHDIQDLLGPVPEGFDDYFSSKFPKLFIEVYNVVRKHCIKEDIFGKYF